jgi:hypothetical protein
MTDSLFLPYQEQIVFYYELFKQGLSEQGIKEKFLEKFPNVSDNKYASLMPLFFNFTRLSLRESQAQNGVVKIPLTQALEKNFIYLVRNGLPFDKAAKLLNIPLVTVTEFWFREYPLFKMKVDYAIELTNAEIVQALHKRAKGFSKILRSKSVTTGRGTGGMGEEVVNTTTTEREEYIAPDVAAAKFWLVNKSPEDWRPDGKGTKEGNRGKILETIDEMTEMTEDDKEDL